MRYVWFLVVALGCSGGAEPGLDSAVDSGRDAGPDPEDAGPDTTICFETGVCEPRPCEFVTYFSGTPEPGLNVSHVDYLGTEHPLTDGGEAHVNWGFQGWVMLQPYLDVAAEDFETDLRCAEIVITQAAVEGEPFPRSGHDSRHEGAERTLIFDEISFESVDGREMDLEIVVRTGSWARTTGPMRVTLVEGPVER